jgi:hypothetical protein
MADGITYGLYFPFRNSTQGDYLALTEFESEEIKSDLIYAEHGSASSRSEEPQSSPKDLRASCLSVLSCLWRK